MATGQQEMSKSLKPAAETASRRAPVPWIVATWQDLALFVATPLLLIPLFFLSRQMGQLEAALVLVAGFGAAGHHLPGMMRAYGDRELFRRFRVRFILAPLFLLGMSLYFAHENLRGLSIIALLWGTWHFFMQVYGFGRIYDAKVKATDSTTIWLDFLLCGSWFVAAELFSSQRVSDLLVLYYESGGPLLPPAGFQVFRIGWGIFTGLVTGAFLSNHFLRIYRGEPTSSVKLLLLSVCIAYWWFLMVSIENVVLGIALFEIFHDVQYLSIVWIFNRSQIQRGKPVGRFTRFLFQKNGMLIGVYVGLVAAYGYLGFLGELSDPTRGLSVAYALIIASTLLHFYFDGFIWKVREKSTRESLGMTGGGTGVNRRIGIPSWMTHGLKWSFLVIPAAFLGFSQAQSQSREPASLIELRQNVVAIVPDNAQAQNELAAALMEVKKDYNSAAEHAQRAVDLDPEMAEGRYNLGLALAMTGREREAIPHFRRAVELAGDHVDARVNLAVALRSRGENLGEVVGLLQRAVELRPEDQSIALKLADAMVSHAWNLATAAESSREELDEAVQLLRRADRYGAAADPRLPDITGAIFARQGRFDQAVRAAETALNMARQAGPEAAEYVKQVAARVELYRQSKPYHQPAEGQPAIQAVAQ